MRKHLDLDQIRQAIDPEIRKIYPDSRLVVGAIGPLSSFQGRPLWDSLTIAYLDLRNWKQLNFTWDEVNTIAHWFETTVAAALLPFDVYMGRCVVDPAQRPTYSPLNNTAKLQQNLSTPTLVFQIGRHNITQLQALDFWDQRGEIRTYSWLIGIRDIDKSVIEYLCLENESPLDQNLPTKEQIFETLVADLLGKDLRLEEIFPHATTELLRLIPDTVEKNDLRRMILRIILTSLRPNGDLHSSRASWSPSLQQLINYSCVFIYGSNKPPIELLSAPEEFLNQLFEKSPFLVFCSKRSLDFLYTVSKLLESSDL